MLIAPSQSAHVAEPAAHPFAQGVLTAAQIGRLPSRPALSPDLCAGLVAATESLLLAAQGLGLASLWVGTAETIATVRYPIAIAAVVLAAAVLARRCGLYTLPLLLAPTRQAPRIAAAWTMAVAVLVVTLFLFKSGPDFSRGWLLLWYSSGFIGLIAFRMAAAACLRHLTQKGLLCRRVVVYGSGTICQALLRELASGTASDVRLVATFSDRSPVSSAAPAPQAHGFGDIDALIDFARANPIDLVIVAMPMAAEDRLVEVLHRLDVLPVDIRLAAAASRLRLHRRAYSYLGDIALIDLSDKPLTDWGRIAKGTFDRIVAASALLPLAPVMALIALAIKLESKGPVLFRQKRFGFNNELIEVLKFRSMFTDRCDANAQTLVTKHDRRVTRVGRVLRRTSLDELPQLINVLRGELSLVGPRPHALEAKAADRLYGDVVEDYFARHKVKPGITGWAQINGWRGETDTPEKIRKRVEHDLHYIENWSLLFDLIILARTPLALLKAENAY